VDVDFPKDLFYITYDPEKLTVEKILETVRKEGLEGEVVPGGPPSAKDGEK
jgi:hypothetical protein